MSELPGSLESEKAVLGVVMVSPVTKSKEFASSMTVDHFLNGQNREVATSCLQAISRREQPDRLAIAADLQRRSVKSVAPVYLQELEGAADRAGWAQNCKRLHKCLSLRKLIQVASLAIDGAYQQEEPDRLLAGLSSGLAAISLGTSDSMLTSDEVVKQAISVLTNRAKGEGKPTGVLTGIPDLDKITTGFREPDLVVICARTGGGKTALAMQCVYNHARNGGAAAVFNCEMQAYQLVERELARDGRIDSSKLALGDIDIEAWENIRASAQGISRRRVWYEDRVSRSSDIVTRAREWRTKNQDVDGLVVVDFLQLVRGVASARDSYSRQIGQIAQDMKELARELKVPVILVSQMNREGVNRDGPPRLADLKESGDIENAADKVIAPYNPEQEEDGEIEIHVLKNRGGRAGKVAAHWTGKHYLMTGVSLEEPF